MDEHLLRQNLFKLCLAGAIGTFVVTFGDLCNNGQSASLLKAAEALRLIIPGLPHGPLIAFGSLIILGGALCWIHRPGTRTDAFLRGFAVFAALAAAVPYHGVTESLKSPTRHQYENKSSLLTAKNAYAQEQDTPIKPSSSGTTTGTAKIIIARPIKNVNVILRDPNSTKIIASEKVSGNSFVIKKPVGKYQVEVESAGFRRTTTEITLSKKKKEYVLQVKKSRVPLSIQRLVNPKSSELIEKQTQH